MIAPRIIAIALARHVRGAGGAGAAFSPWRLSQPSARYAVFSQGFVDLAA